MSNIKEINDTIAKAPVNELLHKVRARPFVKWAGGKRSLIPILLQHLPEKIDNYWEPFVGGGALFYAIESRLKHAHLSDANVELMIAYRMVQKRCSDLIKELEEHKRNHSDWYYKDVRKQTKIDDPVKRAARFIYLNKTCFNGLYRVNKSGAFNVPIGHYKNPAIVDTDNLWSASAALTKATLRWIEFNKIEPQPQKGDLVYCDPPYDETYDQYTPRRFNYADQQHLADFANKWHKSGASVIISNSDTPFIREIYKSAYWKIHKAAAINSINCKGDGRTARQETIITNVND